MSAFVSAVVLAAGMSKRMGMLKQLVRVGNRTLLEKTLDAVAGSRVSETILVLGYQADAIRETLQPGGSIRVVLNSSYAEGMSASIRAGIGAVSADCSAVLIILADQPLLTSSILNLLIDEYERGHAPIVLPVYRGFRGNPVLIGRSLFTEMLQITGDVGCRSIFGLHSEQIHKVSVDDIGVLVDIDTVEDLERVNSLPTESTEDLLRTLDVSNRSVAATSELIIIGTEDVAIALAKLAKVLQLRVVVVDPLAAPKELPEADCIVNELDRDKWSVGPETSIVIASRGRFDEEALEQAAASEAKYIALVGSRKRGAELIERLRAKHLSEQAISRIRCPAGLEIHASTSEEIALSVLAEIVGVRNS